MDFSESNVDTEYPLMTKTCLLKRSNKCNQCEYASSQASNLRRHLKAHTGEKSNKCNQCDYASSVACHLRRHLKTHGGEKSNKCNQCEYASFEAGNLRRHLKTHHGESQMSATSVTLHPLRNAI